MATINISFEVPDDKQADILDAFVRSHSWDENSPDTKQQAFKKALINYVRDHYRGYKARQSVAQAATASDQETGAVVIA